MSCVPDESARSKTSPFSASNVSFRDIRVVSAIFSLAFSVCLRETDEKPEDTKSDTRGTGSGDVRSTIAPSSELKHVERLRFNDDSPFWADLEA